MLSFQPKTNHFLSILSPLKCLHTHAVSILLCFAIDATANAFKQPKKSTTLRWRTKKKKKKRWTIRRMNTTNPAKLRGEKNFVEKIQLRTHQQQQQKVPKRNTVQLLFFLLCYRCCLFYRWSEQSLILTNSLESLHLFFFYLTLKIANLFTWILRLFFHIPVYVQIFAIKNSIKRKGCKNKRKKKKN